MPTVRGITPMPSGSNLMNSSNDPGRCVGLISPTTAASFQTWNASISLLVTVGRATTGGCPYNSDSSLLCSLPLTLPLLFPPPRAGEDEGGGQRIRGSVVNDLLLLRPRRDRVFLNHVDTHPRARGH